MSAFQDLLSAGMQLFEAATPSTVIFEGDATEYACVAVPLEFAEQLRPGMLRASTKASVEVRKTILATVPAIGTRATLNGKLLRLESYGDDDVAYTLNFSERAK